MKKSSKLEDKLTAYILPVSGMKVGTHHFNFEVGNSFFGSFPDTYIHEGAVKVHLDFDKRVSMYILDFRLEGNVRTTCDRCTEEMWLDVESEEQLLVKFSDTPSKDADVVHVPLDTETLSVAQYVYEFICLAIPISKTHDDIDEDCPEAVWKYLQTEEEQAEKEEESNPFKDAFKDLDITE